MTSVWWLRWVLVAIAVVLGALLIGRHHILFGVLILAMALVRGVVLVIVRRRRAAWRQRRHTRTGPLR